MTETVTLTARTAPLDGEPRVETRSPERSDIPALSKLYSEAYGDAANDGGTETADEEMTAAFDGRYGKLLLESSRVALDDDGRIIAGVLVVERPEKPDAPQVPFLVALVTDPQHRREGLALQLVQAASDKLHDSGYEQIAVTLDEDNAAALALYLSIDFRRWEPEPEESE